MKNRKRLISLISAAALTLSLGVGALADNPAELTTGNNAVDTTKGSALAVTYKYDNTSNGLVARSLKVTWENATLNFGSVGSYLEWDTSKNEWKQKTGASKEKTETVTITVENAGNIPETYEMAWAAADAVKDLVTCTATDTDFNCAAGQKDGDGKLVQTPTAYTMGGVGVQAGSNTLGTQAYYGFKDNSTVAEYGADITVVNKDRFLVNLTVSDVTKLPTATGNDGAAFGTLTFTITTNTIDATAIPSKVPTTESP